MKKLPLDIDTEITIRSMEHQTVKTTSRIIGARHGEFILIEEPVFPVSERLSLSVNGKFMCSFLHDGDVYYFQSGLQETLKGGLTFIDYPSAFQVEVIRKHRRVQVSLEARFRLENSKETIQAAILDISEGGRLITVGSLLHLTQNMGCIMDFILPDRQHVEQLQGKVRTFQHSIIKKVTELGVQFLGPKEELAKIVAFCRYCMYFKV